eukprot:gene14965-17162_t
MNNRNYIHRDIKPGNILLDATGHVKLADFGTACTLDNVPKQQVSSPSEGPMVGTLAYMPPERFKPNSSHSVKGDLWSLGVTLVHLLQGKHPFSEKLGYWELRSCVATTPVEHILRHDDKCSQDLANFLARCVVRRVDERASVKELLQSPFLQRAAAEGVVPCTDRVGTEAAAVASDGGASERALKENADLPKLTSLVQSLQDDELTVSVLKIVSSIVAEATAPEEDFGWKIAALSEQLALPSEILESMVRETHTKMQWEA